MHLKHFRRGFPSHGAIGTNLKHFRHGFPNHGAIEAEAIRTVSASDPIVKVAPDLP